MSFVSGTSTAGNPRLSNRSSRHCRGSHDGHMLGTRVQSSDPLDDIRTTERCPVHFGRCSMSSELERAPREDGQSGGDVLVVHKDSVQRKVFINELPAQSRARWPSSERYFLKSPRRRFPEAGVSLSAWRNRYIVQGNHEETNHNILGTRSMARTCTRMSSELGDLAW